MIADIASIILGVVLITGTALFVSAEFSFVALDQAAVERRVAGGDKSAAQALKAIKTLSTQLSGAQVGITLTTILLGYTTQRTLSDLFTTWLGMAGVAQALATTIAVIVAGIVINLLSMLFGELVPKNMALAHPLKTAGVTAPFQMLFSRVFKPLIVVLNDSANWVLRRMGVEPQEEISSARSANELAALVRHSADEGKLDLSTASLFTKSIRLGELTAVDVMTDRGLVEAIDSTCVAQDVVERARETGHSRFPVIGEDFDEVLGLVSLRRAIAVPFEKRGEVSVQSSSLMADAPRVPETMELAPLLVELREDGVQMAIVVDEYGGVSGIVTLEDVVEEIVGEVSDEHDHRRRGIRLQPDGSYLVPGWLRPDELQEQTGLTVPDDGPYETLAGLMMTQLQRVPEIGDSTHVSGMDMSVTHMKGRRILQIRLVAPHTEEPAQVTL